MTAATVANAVLSLKRTPYPAGAVAVCPIQRRQQIQTLQRRQFRQPFRQS